jgi:small subunit ribosomal protein S8
VWPVAGFLPALSHVPALLARSRSQGPYPRPDQGQLVIGATKMGMTDPIADMLTRIRNASRARHQRVSVPWSRLKESIIKILIEEGYLKDQKKVKAAVGGGEEIVIQLKFDRENRPIIAGLKRVSTPGRRVYVSSKAMAPVRKGLGVHVLSTPKGILVDREAQKAKVGGELICSVW